MGRVEVALDHHEDGGEGEHGDAEKEQEVEEDGAGHGLVLAKHFLAEVELTTRRVLGRLGSASRLDLPVKPHPTRLDDMPRGDLGR